MFFEVGSNVSSVLVYMAWIYVLMLVFRAIVNVMLVYLQKPSETIQRIETRIVEEEDSSDDNNSVV